VILQNGTLVTFWEKSPLVEDALLAVEGKSVVDFGKVGKLIDRYDDPETFDVGGRVIMPGLINAHTHLYSSLARGMGLKGDAPRNFLEVLEKIWWRLDRALNADDVYLSAMVGLMDAVRAGVTTVVDHHSSPIACSGSLDAVQAAFAEIGVRGCLAYEVSDRDGPAVAAAGIDENTRFLELCRKTRSDMMSGLFGLHASFTLSDTTLARAVLAATSLKAGFHIHVAEDRCDVDDAQAQYGLSPVKRLIEAGALNQKSLAAHCVHLEQDDYPVLRDSGARVVHNPQSNAANAVGTADLLRLASERVPVVLGSDGFSPGIFEDFRAAVLHQRSLASNPAVALDEAHRAAFIENADLATALFGPTIGRIKPGARADLLVVDYHPPTPMTPENLAGHLYYGISRAPAWMVVINGKVVYREGRFAALDEPRVRARAQEAAARLWERL
jgi:putative selenium metabolism protein SsnA